MTFKPIDAKRDDFRKYLERSGALEAVSRSFAKLYECPDRPENAINFLLGNLGEKKFDLDKIEHLKKEIDHANNEILKLNQQIETLKLEHAKEKAAILADAANSTTIVKIPESEKSHEIENQQESNVNNLQVAEVQIINSEADSTTTEISTDFTAPKIETVAEINSIAETTVSQ